VWDIFPEYTPEKAFERFYDENYEKLPEWVNEVQFKTNMKQSFLYSITEARQKDESTFPAGMLLHPLIGDRIDMGSADNYTFYFEKF